MPNQTAKTAASPPAKEGPKATRRDLLHVAYVPIAKSDNTTSFDDIVVFGTRLEAVEYGLEHGAKVATLTKGQSLRESLGKGQS
ncbi:MULTISPECIES: hypothetical protein [unclassified Aeromicrobium]|uniref:hypothetical protein n=1 Tax=unclassified Aeromicrobium TaxID=2633570 RepID=UPI00288C5B37|nr:MULTISPECIES: hypothetical protein [unclassified Aeromicrobium]